MSHARILIALAAVLAVACGGDDGDRATPTATTPATTPAATPPSVETAGAGRVTPGAYEAVRVMPQFGFGDMLDFHVSPDDPARALVLTKRGVIFIAAIDDESAEPAVFLDVRDRMKPRLDREEGLLSLAFAPDFAQSREFYIYYTADAPRRSVTSRFVADGMTADPASEEMIIDIEQPYGNHNGATLAFGPDGMLYISLGDGGRGGDPHGHGQNTGTWLGSILRIDVSAGGAGYDVPDDNPFVGGGGLPEIWAYGFRNPWRMSFDSRTGDLWAADVGQDEVEEVNLVERGGNYGWNIMEGSRCYAAAICSTEGLIFPRAEYTHEFGCSVTGGHVYYGPSMPELAGWYIYGDFCSGNIWAFDTTDASSKPVLLAETGLQISSFGLDPAGELIVVTFDGQLARLIRAG